MSTTDSIIEIDEATLSPGYPFLLETIGVPGRVWDGTQGV